MKSELTTAVEAYNRGRADRRANPEAESWQDINPYNSRDLFYPWLDGWRDEAGDYYWHAPGVEALGPVQVGVEGGRCPHCWHYPLRRLRDGRLWCLQYPCRSVAVRPKGRVIDEVPSEPG